MLVRTLKNNESGWFPNWMLGSLKPDVIIGNNYLARWWVIPRNPLLNIYLHKIMRSDDARALHDHPWHNLSVILAGSYQEVTLCSPDIARLLERNPDKTSFWDEGFIQITRFPGEFIFRRPRVPHRLKIRVGAPVWALFITGPRIRQWGFHCAEEWLHWREYSIRYGEATN